MRFIFTREDFYLEEGSAQRSDELEQWKEQFTENKYQTWYQLGLENRVKEADSSMLFLQQVSESFFRQLTLMPELEVSRGEAEPELSEDICNQLINLVPFTIGAEYIDEQWLMNAFHRLRSIFQKEITAYHGTVAMYLAEKSQHLHVPERIFFHLVENKEEDYPFAFLATYATRGDGNHVKHMPLQYALKEYGKERDKLLSLLSCLNRASEVSEFVRTIVESGEMFHPLRLTSVEAYEFLKDIPKIEETGILCRIPNWWKKHASSVNLTVQIGEEKPAMLGFDTILSLQPKLMVDGVPLTREDIEHLLAQTDGLAFLKGKWIEVEHERLKQLLLDLEENRGEITLLEALRGGNSQDESKEGADVGPLITNGAWLAGLLQQLRKPDTIRKARIPVSVHAELRPYQKSGYTWLSYMNQLGFGACLADDMGLGKTLQVLTFLEKLRKEGKTKRVLLIVPASLLGNWCREAEKFVPQMEIRLLHGKTGAILGEQLVQEECFLTITTYGMSQKIKVLQELEWDCLILDEAQAIKNAATKQTHAIKQIPARMRLAMTGTPIENDLTNLWSLFDFLNKGLLGTSVEFKSFTKQLSAHPEKYAQLKAMISPFLLRRVKTDKKIISDLPEKVETIDYVGLSKKQVVLYRKQVTEVAEKLEELDGIARKGLILTALMHLKQICNHPDQYLGQETYTPEDSGKFEMLKEICETIYEKRERVIIFTQFKEMTEPISNFLREVFHTRGLVLHGGVPAAKRSELVEQFNGEKYVPYMVLSVKAGGTGLNLTKANHVIHFDRWWNPAVENQATDRAYRIGQKQNVFVHKLVCEKTIEEKIDAMIASKKELAENVIGAGKESFITEMSNDELLSMLRLG